MRVTYNGSVFKIDHDASDLQECFGFLGACQELFGAAEKCENCQGTDLRPKYRKTKGGYEFYSLECSGCHYEFKFGQKKEGGLYPKGWEAGWEQQKQPKSDGDLQSYGTSAEETERQGRDRF